MTDKHLKCLRFGHWVEDLERAYEYLKFWPGKKFECKRCGEMLDLTFDWKIQIYCFDRSLIVPLEASRP